VVDALAGRGGVYRFATDTPGEPERLVDAGGLVGLAFSPDGTLALATSETIYRLDAGVRGLLPCGRP